MESDRYLEELREYANNGRSCSRAAVAWALRIVDPMIESVRAWEGDGEEEDEDDGT